jgi:hypothetical protein
MWGNGYHVPLFPSLPTIPRHKGSILLGLCENGGVNPLCVPDVRFFRFLLGILLVSQEHFG